MNVTPTPSSSPRPVSPRSASEAGPGGRRRRRGVVAGLTLLMAGAGVAAAAPAVAATPVVLNPLQVVNSCKSPGQSGDVRNGYYTSVTLRGSDTARTFTFDSMTIKGSALTSITPKQVEVPALSTTTVSLLVQGAKSSANGPGVLQATAVQPGGAPATFTATLTSFPPMHSSDCKVSYPASSTVPWSTGRVVSFDAYGNAQGDVPADAQSGIVAVADGYGYAMALTAKGTVVGWGPGYNPYHPEVPPAGLSDVKAIAGSSESALALKNDGTVVGWGNVDRPAVSGLIGLTDVKGISVAEHWGTAVTSGGSLIVSGNTETWGPAWVPDEAKSHVVQAAANFEGAVVVKDDGTVVSWNADGTMDIPAVTNAVSVAAGGGGVVALLADGTVVTWYGKDTAVVATGATSVAYNSAGTLYVSKKDGTVDAVHNDGSTYPVPVATGATQISAQGEGGYAVVGTS